MAQVKVNLNAPDFTLVDFNGQPIRLSSFEGRKNVVLVFNRGFI